MVWDAPPGLSVTQSIPLHMIHFLSNWLKRPSVLDNEKQFLVVGKSAEWQSKFRTVRNETLLVLYRAAVWGAD